MPIFFMWKIEPYHRSTKKNLKILNGNQWQYTHPLIFSNIKFPEYEKV